MQTDWFLLNIYIYMVKNGVDNKYDGVSAANTHTAYDWGACKGMSAGCLGYSDHSLRDEP